MCVECMRENHQGARKNSIGEKDDKMPRVKISTSADDVRMFELECQIEKSKETLLSNASKENLHYQQRPLGQANQSLNRILKKSSSDLQRDAYSKRTNTDVRAQSVKKRAVSTGRSGKHFSVSKKRERAVQSGRTSQTDFIQRNRQFPSIVKANNSASTRFFRL